MRDRLQAASARLLPPKTRSVCTDLGLLAARLGFGWMMLTHGYGKLVNFGPISEKFMSFLWLPPSLSLGLAVFAEFFCSILLMLGLFTRFAAFNLAVTMVVAGFYVHWSDDFATKEKALLYLTGYGAILLAGPGRIAADHWLFGGKPGSDAKPAA